ncbi:putative copper resistance protein D [Pseudomonas sp. ok272]|uniref:copper homeostasis membrane protein CopD n=1 Tax=unclassified Pseudomonas TaxID=196821 RepID=UPI0008D267AE|nr:MULTISPECIES: copper homeostasis membrane protein CopD [unclassified Pseudomonas]SEN19593.1 putative copper resistance protein D [Pseudomonas sp. ok272]SFN11692.1 putative copper resistance protein D [Pseudomonas sp. ok602]
MATALVLCRFLHFTAVLLLFGAGVLKPWLLRQAPHTPALDQCLARQSRWLAGFALCSAVAWLLLITLSMAGTLDGPSLLRVLGSTFFGQVWRWHLLFNLLLLVCVLSPLNKSPPLRLGLTSLLLMTLAPVGHGAMLDGLGGQLLILNQIIHLACVGAWLGGLMVLAMILRKPAGHGIGPILLRFSGVGYGLVGGLLVTGLINVRVLTGALWPTPLLSGFALILSIKVLLVGVMLGLALFNRLRIKDCEQRLATLRNSVMLEWLFGVAAVAAVSLLGTLPPL